MRRLTHAAAAAAAAALPNRPPHTHTPVKQVLAEAFVAWLLPRVGAAEELTIEIQELAAVREWVVGAGRACACRRCF